MHHEWRRLRADELREQASRDAIVILPVASLEQHGPHLPVEVNSMLGETVAARTAEKALAKGQPVPRIARPLDRPIRTSHELRRDGHAGQCGFCCLG